MRAVKGMASSLSVRHLDCPWSNVFGRGRMPAHGSSRTSVAAPTHAAADAVVALSELATPRGVPTVSITSTHGLTRAPRRGAVARAFVRPSMHETRSAA